MAKRPSVSTLVQRYIRDYIVREKLHPGDALPPEGQIAAELEVSRISAREGVRVLETLGILEVRHGNGLFVRGLNLDALLEMLSYNLLLDLSSLKELHQIRKWFAIGTLPDVIQRIEEEELLFCHECLQEWERRIAARLAFDEQDRLFHLTLSQSLGNKLMLELENIFWEAYRNTEARMVSFHVASEDAPQVLQAHLAVLAAIETRNVESAQRLMAATFEEFEMRFKLVVKDSQQ